MEVSSGGAVEGLVEGGHALRCGLAGRYLARCKDGCGGDGGHTGERADGDAGNLATAQVLPATAVRSRIAGRALSRTCNSAKISQEA